jgi:uncharacterized protein YndB with AHSA1/START domain
LKALLGATNDPRRFDIRSLPLYRGPKCEPRMRNVIQQTVVLPASAATLFDMYLDPAAHAAITGFPVRIAAEPGSAFHAFNKQLSGQILAVVRPQLIVQSWRSVKFRDSDPDATLILVFTPDESDARHGRIDLVHLDVPDHDFREVTEGWHKHYWNPWRIYLESQETQDKS